jgi:hypothetical protein
MSVGLWQRVQGSKGLCRTWRVDGDKSRTDPRPIHQVASGFIMLMCVAFFPLRRSSLRQSSCSRHRCRPRRKCAAAGEPVLADTPVGMADSLGEAGLVAAIWVAATLSAACTPVQPSGRAASIEDLRSTRPPFVEIASAGIASVTIVFTTGVFVTSDSGTVLAAGAGVDGPGGTPATTIRTGGGTLVHLTTKIGLAKSSWRMR